MAKEERLIEEIRQKVAEFISRESNRTSLITITRAELSKNSKTALLFFTVLPENMEEGALEFLKRNRTDIRNYLLENIRTGRIPTIDFLVDRGEKNRQRLDEISRDN